MASLNKVFLLGNLTRDPEVRYTTGGSAICTFGLAMNRRYTTSQGEEREEVCFADIEVWGKQAETCGNYLAKGAPALVEGRLRYDQWDDRETGKKRSRLIIRADRVQFVGPPSRGRGFDEDGGGEDQGGGPPRGGYQQRRPPQQQSNRNEPPGMPPFEPVSDAEMDDDIPF